MTHKNCRYGIECYRRCEKHRARFAHPGDEDWLEQEVCCPCGGGQSCIIDRRLVGDWVHEDSIFLDMGLPVRMSCIEPLGAHRERAIRMSLRGLQTAH